MIIMIIIINNNDNNDDNNNNKKGALSSRILRGQAYPGHQSRVGQAKNSGLSEDQIRPKQKIGILTVLILVVELRENFDFC